jgi:hypothetical protein
VSCAEVSRVKIKQTVKLPVLKSVRHIISGQVTKQTAIISLNCVQLIVSDVTSTHILISLYKN